MERTVKHIGFEDAHGRCLQCSLQWSGEHAATDAIAHHNATGHHVRVEQTLWWERKLRTPLPYLDFTTNSNTVTQKMPQK
jgi:hypothetical protein